MQLKFEIKNKYQIYIKCKNLLKLICYICSAKRADSDYNPLRPRVLPSVNLWDITQNRLLTSTDS